MRHFNLTLTLVAVVLLGAGSASGQIGVGPSFSLDDNPAMPLTSPPGFIPGFGAEDPYGMGTYGGPIWAPSPSLPVVPAMDADILRPPPGTPVPFTDVVMSLPYGQPFGYVDAVSRDSDKSLNTGLLHLSFSVDRISKGMIGTAVDSEFILNQQPGDIYRTSSQFPHPVNFLGMPTIQGYNGPLPTAGVGGTNLMLLDESQLHLTAGNGPGMLIQPGVPCPPIMRGTHDNADAVEFQVFDVNGDGHTDTSLYFSVAPDEMGVSGFMPQEIYHVPPGLPANNAALFASGFFDIGLIGGEGDDIDALVVWEDPDPTIPPGFLNPGKDYALFSLSHGSTSLNQWGLTESDIFFTDFTGGFWLFARAMDLALVGGPGMLPGDNVDALETLYPGDANLDDCVDGLDYVIWSNSYFPIGASTGWLQGDFTGDGLTDGLDYVVWSNNYQMGCPVVPTAVPEPASAVLLVLGICAIRRRRRA